MVELTSSRIDSPPRRVGNRKSSYDNDGADVVLLRAEGVSVDDLKRVGSRTFFLESTEVLMDIVAVSEEGPYQDRPPLCPFRLSPLLTCSGSTIAFLKILKIQGPNPKI